MRPLFSSLTNIHHDAPLPKWASVSERLSRSHPSNHVNCEGDAASEQVLLFPGCFSNYNQPNLALDAVYVLNKQGVQCESLYPGCCGMPQLEQGDLASVSEKAASIATELTRRVRELQTLSSRNVTVVSLTPSCSFMIKSEWPLLLPHDENIRNLASMTSDISEYVSKIFKKYSPAAGMTPLPNNERAILHSACHSRAQNVGNRAQQILQYIPKLSVSVVNKCSGHGGLWGCKSSTHASALKTGHAAKVAIEKSIEQAKKEASHLILSPRICLAHPATGRMLNVHKRMPVGLQSPCTHAVCRITSR
jgi:glycerol-3-phosphate dehydrogenase subunit C